MVCICGVELVRQTDLRQRRCAPCTGARNAKWRDGNPWVKSLNKARQRCNYRKHRNYARYGGRGIRCHITFAETKALWLRDQAALMDWPTLDRKDSDGDYTKENCRFIEHRHNSRDGGHRSWVSRNALRSTAAKGEG